MPDGIRHVKPLGIGHRCTLDLVAEISTPAVRLRQLCDLVVREDPEHNERRAGERIGLPQWQINRVRAGARSGASPASLEAVIKKTSLDPRFFFDDGVRVEEWEKWRRSRARLRVVTPPDRPAAVSLDGFHEFAATLAAAFAPPPTPTELDWLRDMPHGGMAGDYANALSVARRSASSSLGSTGLRSVR